MFGPRTRLPILRNSKYFLIQSKGASSDHVREPKLGSLRGLSCIIWVHWLVATRRVAYKYRQSLPAAKGTDPSFLYRSSFAGPIPCCIRQQSAAESTFGRSGSASEWSALPIRAWSQLFQSHDQYSGIQPSKIIDFTVVPQGQRLYRFKESRVS